jgi:site-specific DNA-methyltransferase (adenine-specific)
MNGRQRAFRQSLDAFKTDSVLITRGSAAHKSRPASASRRKPYNRPTMLEPNKIYQGDSIQLLNHNPEGWVDLVFADPPFNIGFLYDKYNDNKKTEDYLNFSRQWIKAVHRALKPNGSFFLAIGDDYAADLCVIARREIGFHLRNWIVWHYTFGQQTKFKFAKSHTHILYFSKDEKQFTFNSDAVRVASARSLIYSDPRANPKGKLPDDTWYLRPPETDIHFQPEQDVWCESRVCGTFKEREGWHGCQMPIRVLDRIIKAASNKGDIVLDPFNGSGTTVVSAALLDRKYVGIDQSADYVGWAEQRLKHAMENREGALPDGLPKIFDPERVSRKQTITDAFGRKRVPRGPHKRKAAALLQEE